MELRTTNPAVVREAYGASRSETDRPAKPMRRDVAGTRPAALSGLIGEQDRSGSAPQFAYSSSNEEKLPPLGFFPGISDEEILKTEEEGGEVQEHQLPVLPEERDSRLNRQADRQHGVAAAKMRRLATALRAGRLHIASTAAEKPRLPIPALRIPRLA